MTNHDEKPENNPSDPVEPNAESIIIGFGRGSYSAVNDAEDSPLLFERFLDQSKGPREPYPDIDGNFVDGDRIRAETLKFLQERYSNPERRNGESATLDGFSTKEEVIEKARNAGSVDLTATHYKIF